MVDDPQVTVNGNRFVDPAQRPADWVDYFQTMVNQTRKANALLPSGAPKHKVLVYTDNYASTGVNDSALFADSIVYNRFGEQQAYINCTKPGGPPKTQLRMFYADGRNSYSKGMSLLSMSFSLPPTLSAHRARAPTMVLFMQICRSLGTVLRAGICIRGGRDFPRWSAPPSFVCPFWRVWCYLSTLTLR